jgi:hypothetical protein
LSGTPRCTSAEALAMRWFQPMSARLRSTIALMRCTLALR